MSARRHPGFGRFIRCGPRKQAEFGRIERPARQAIDQNWFGDGAGLHIGDHHARALRSEVPIAKGEQGHQHGTETPSSLSEDIVIGRGFLAVAPPLEQSRVDQSRKPARQNVGRNLEALLEFVEARHAGKSVAQNENAPPFTDARKAARDRAVRFDEACLLHKRAYAHSDYHNASDWGTGASAPWKRAGDAPTRGQGAICLPRGNRAFDAGVGWTSPLARRNGHLPWNDSSLNGDVSIGDNLGTLIFMKPKPVDS